MLCLSNETHIHIRIYTYIRIHNIDIYIYTYPYIHVYIYIYTYTYIHITYTFTYNIHIHMRAQELPRLEIPTRRDGSPDFVTEALAAWYRAQSLECVDRSGYSCCKKFESSGCQGSDTPLEMNTNSTFGAHA